ncbi:MAG: hypothetical protein ACQET3_01470, partial [Promethearchaeati archaeon]
MSSFDDAQDALYNLGKQIVDSLNDGDFPALQLPDRTTNNILFDETTGQFVLGGSHVTRDSKNTKHIKSLSQLMWVAAFAKKLLGAQRTSSLRDLYYSSDGEDVKFSSQSESDRIVADLESFTGLAREDFGIGLPPRSRGDRSSRSVPLRVKRRERDAVAGASVL